MARIDRRSCFALLLSSLSGVATRSAGAEEAKRPTLSPAIERVLAWLPADTETVTAVQSFTIPAKKSDKEIPNSEPSKEAFIEGERAGILGVLAALQDGKYLQPLAGEKVVLALRGARNFETVTSTLPTHRSEHCTVVVFENDLPGTSKEWIAALREGAGEVRKMVGRDVYVFPATNSIRPAREPKWPGKLAVYLVLLSSITLLCATSDRYLEEVLQRVNAPPAERALPANLPEWKHVDPEAPAWMVRHVPMTREGSPPNQQAGIAGVTWTMSADRFRVVYLPGAAVPERVEKTARDTWSPDELDVHPTIERLKDGTVVVSSTTKNDSSAEFWFLLSLYYLEAEMGALQD